MRFALLALVLGCSSAYADTDVRPVGTFHGVDNAAVLDVDIAIGATARVELSGPKDWLARIETRVNGDGILELRMPDDHHNLHNPPKLHAQITVPALDLVMVSGVGDMRVGKLSTRALAVKLSGVGNITLAGSTEVLDAKLSGIGDIRARDLTAKAADVRVSGTGDMHVRVTDAVTAKVSGMGDITIAGRPPQVHRKVSGMGEIRME